MQSWSWQPERADFSARRRYASEQPPQAALSESQRGFPVIRPVNENPSDLTTFGHLPFQGRQGRFAPGRAPLSGDTAASTNRVIKHRFYFLSTEYRNIRQCVQVCPPLMVQLAEIQFYVFEVLDFPNTSCIISSNENVLGFWKCSTLTKLVDS